ncbi:hypothetical protein NP233_g6261 [Leucocoprinus birnbaumii]|uniref:Fungal N-terminal domain-containing protein n=1 Tax=Leucocoprinus birnbaumii TaxID=56174 RepID=A0AAD5VWX9_9AGAR|nr:hypothetical protein NP233_g6261 [Leucocoprinus birnbaumii]
MQGSPFSFLASAIAATLGVSIESILVDISEIKRRVASLDAAINTCSTFCETGDSTIAMNIHLCAEDTRTAIIKTIKDVKTIPSPVTVSDGVRVLNSVNSLKPLVLEALRRVVAKKPILQSLGRKSIMTYVTEDLIELNLTTSALQDALISRAPAQLLQEANAIKVEIDNAFAVAIAALNRVKE